MYTAEHFLRAKWEGEKGENWLQEAEYFSLPTLSFTSAAKNPPRTSTALRHPLFK